MSEQNEPTCKSCGKAYIEHLGLIGTCKSLQDALSALKVIRTWATFEDVAMDRDQVAKLCNKILKDQTK
jgi:hypothetical protein